VWGIELAVAGALGPPGVDEVAGGVEYLDAVVAAVGDVDTPGGVDGDPLGTPELAVALA